MQSGMQNSVALDAELEHVKSYLETWIQTWCSQEENPHLRWHLLHDALSCWLLLVVSVARTRFQLSQGQKNLQLHRNLQQKQQRQQQVLLKIATRMFNEALKVPRALRITHRASIFPFAA